MTDFASHVENCSSPKDDIFLRHGFGQDPLLLLAPMEGITNRTFRQLLCETAPPDIVATEFQRITGKRQKIRPFARHESSGTILQIQIMGTESDVLASCVRFLKERGVLTDTDWLDLNVGCPSRRVNSHGAGAALLCDLPKLAGIILALRNAHPGPLSIKTRLGYQSEEDFPSLIRCLQDMPLDFLTIHARTRCAGYDQPILLEYLASAARLLPYPVIGNGDVRTPEGAIKMLQETGVRGVMCGRGVIVNPFLFHDIRQTVDGPFTKRALPLKSPTSRLYELEQFCNTLLNRYALRAAQEQKRLIGLFKEFAGWFSQNPLIGREYFHLVKRTQSFEELGELTRRYFSELHYRTTVQSSEKMGNGYARQAS